MYNTKIFNNIKDLYKFLIDNKIFDYSFKKYDLWIKNDYIDELEIVLKAKEMIKDYINQGLIGLYYNLNKGKNYGIRLTKSKEKYIDLGNGQYFEIKRKID